MTKVATWLLGSALLLGATPWATAQFPNANRTSGPSKVSPSVEAWVKTLAGKIADRHDEVRQSARRAILAIGRDALPTLRQVAKGQDDAAAYAAQRLIERIEHRARGPRGSRHFARGWPARVGGLGRRSGPRQGGGPAEQRPGGRGPGSGGFGGTRGAVGGFGGAWGGFGGARGDFGGFGSAAAGPALGVGPALRPLAGALRGLKLSDKQQNQLNHVPEKLRAELLKELKGILTDEQYHKAEAALKRAPLPPLRVTAPAGRPRIGQ